jgi:hypothetical protein
MARIGEGLRGRWEEGDGLDALGAAVLANHQPHRDPVYGPVRRELTDELRGLAAESVGL